MPWGVSHTCPATSTARWWPGIINCHNHKRLSREEERRTAPSTSRGAPRLQPLEERRVFSLALDEERRAFNLSRDEERRAFNDTIAAPVRLGLHAMGCLPHQPEARLPLLTVEHDAVES